jgi:hypothetical protein
MMRSSEPLPIAPSLPREAIQLEAPAQASPTNRPGRKIAQLGGRSIHQLFKYLKTVYSETIQTHLAAKAKKEAQRKALLLELTTEMHALIIKPENTSSVDSLEQNFFKVFPRWAEIHQTLSRKEEDVKIATEDRIRLKKAEKTLSEFLTETNRLKSPGQTEFFTLKHFSLEEDWNLNYQEEVDFFIWVCCLLPKDLTHLDLSELPLHPVTIKRIKESLPNCKVTAKSKLTIDTA